MRVYVDDRLRNKHTGEIVRVWEVTDDRRAILPSRDGRVQEWPLDALELDWLVVSSKVPQKGDLYRHPTMRGRWKVQSAGPAFVTVRPTLPQLRPKRVPTAQFMDDWELLR